MAQGKENAQQGQEHEPDRHHARDPNAYAAIPNPLLTRFAGRQSFPNQPADFQQNWTVRPSPGLFPPFVPQGYPGLNEQASNFPASPSVMRPPAGIFSPHAPQQALPSPRPYTDAFQPQGSPASGASIQSPFSNYYNQYLATMQPCHGHPPPDGRMQMQDTTGHNGFAASASMTGDFSYPNPQQRYIPGQFIDSGYSTPGNAQHVHVPGQHARQVLSSLSRQGMMIQTLQDAPTVGDYQNIPPRFHKVARLPRIKWSLNAEGKLPPHRYLFLDNSMPSSQAVMITANETKYEYVPVFPDRTMYPIREEMVSQQQMMLSIIQNCGLQLPKIDSSIHGPTLVDTTQEPPLVITGARELSSHIVQATSSKMPKMFLDDWEMLDKAKVFEDFEFGDYSSNLRKWILGQTPMGDGVRSFATDVFSKRLDALLDELEGKVTWFVFFGGPVSC